MKQEIIVRGMTCGHCVASVSFVLEQNKDINTYSVNLETGRVELNSDEEIDLAEVQESLTRVGRYTIELLPHEND